MTATEEKVGHWILVTLKSFCICEFLIFCFGGMIWLGSIIATQLGLTGAIAGIATTFIILPALIGFILLAGVCYD